MAKAKYVVRVVLFDHQLQGVWIGSLVESLRYAGVVSTPRDGVRPEDNTPTLTFDIRPPYGVDSKNWAEMNAQRMQSFGFNAVAALAAN